MIITYDLLSASIFLSLGLIFIFFRRQLAPSKFWFCYDIIHYYFGDKQYLKSKKKISDREKMSLLIGIISLCISAGIIISMIH